MKLVPEASRLQSHAEEIASNGFEREFSDWLKSDANIRRIIAEANEPKLMRLGLYFAYMAGRTNGFRDCAKLAGVDIAALTGRKL